MFRYIVLSVMLFLSLGGTGIAESRIEKGVLNVVSSLVATNVQQILICHEVHAVTDPFSGPVRNNNGQLRPLFMLTNRVDITRLITDLQSDLTKDISIEELPFAGIVSYQVFVTREPPFLVTHVIRGDEGIIVVSVGERTQKGYRLANTEVILFKSPAFSRSVQNFMKAHPNETPKSDP